jgi:hypothetical protein
MKLLSNLLLILALVLAGLGWPTARISLVAKGVFAGVLDRKVGKWISAA